MIIFRVSAALNEFYNESDSEPIAKKIERLNLKDDVKLQRDILRVSSDIVRSWFQFSIDKTVGHITGILAAGHERRQHHPARGWVRGMQAGA